MRGKNKDLKLTAPQLASKDIRRFFCSQLLLLHFDFCNANKHTNKKTKQIWIKDISTTGNSGVFIYFLNISTAVFFLVIRVLVHLEGNFQGRWGNKMFSHSFTTDTQIMCMNIEHNLGSKGWRGEKCSLTADGVFESSLGAFCSQQPNSICLLIPIGYVQWWGLNSSSQSHKPVQKLSSGNLSKVRAP